MNVVIYARFSCKRQTEQSIEGQLKICYEYAAAHNYTVVGEYIDRAQSGTSDNRSDFQRMITDSEKHTFEGVLVYQLDRFARNRYDSAIYKAKLKKNPDNLSIKNLKSSIKEIDEAIENMWLSIEKGGDAVALTERINRRQAEKEDLEEQLAIEQNKRVLLSEAQILAFLNYVCEMPGEDTAKRRAIINIFVHSVYLYDDHLTLIINASNKPVTIDDILLDDIEAAFNGEKSAMEQCSNISDIVPPKADNPKLLPNGNRFGLFSYKR